MANIRVGKVTASVSTSAAHARIGRVSGRVTSTAAAVRVGQVRAAITAAGAAKARIGRIVGNITAPVGAAHGRIGKVTAVVTAPNANPPLVRVRSAGVWKQTTAAQVRKNGAWAPVTPQVRFGSTWKPLSPAAAPAPPLPGFTAVTTDQFAALDPTSWLAYDASNNNQNFGSNQRIGVWTASNVRTGVGSAGSTNGTSMKLVSIETDHGTGTLPTAGALTSGSAGTRFSYTGGMVDSKSAGKFYPRYGRFEWRAKIPHGQGLWTSFWVTAKNGGATTCEMDIVEYFHSQLPAKNSSTIHGTDNTGTFHANRYTNNGNPVNGVGGRTFFEAPTYTPGWHVWACEILPVTDSTGNTLGDPKQPSGFVRLTVFLDGVQVWRVVDTSAMVWTTNGGSEDSFWNVYLQGCQIDGSFVGHPEDYLGYSHQTNACLISGTPPNACSVTTGGYTVQRARFGDPSSVVEIDYQKVWKYTG